MASCVYRALREHGLSVPDDVSVVGGDRVIPENLAPELTQVVFRKFPEDHIFELLEEVISGKTDCFHIEIPLCITEGASVKNIKTCN